MSPLAELLRSHRFALGLRQQELADRVGCERSYLSALENDVKQAPSSEFVELLCRALKLNDTEAEALHLAREKSRRRYSVPPDVSKDAYEAAYEFFARLDRLSALQLQGLMAVLLLGDGARSAVSSAEGRIRRKDRRPQPGKEEAMS